MWSQHAVQALARLPDGRREPLESNRGVDKVSQDRLAGSLVSARFRGPDIGFR